MRQYKNILFALVFVCVFLFQYTLPVHSITISNHSSPKKANYFLSWELTEAQARELSKWDLVILDMELQARHPDLIKKIRQLNRDIILLVYITPQEVRSDALQSYSTMRKQFAKGLSDSWYLHSSAGARLSWWPGTYLLNVTANTLSKDGQTYRDYLTSFVSRELLGSGLWDGVFYDNSWDNISWFAGSDIDLNTDGAKDTGVDVAWRDGMKYIYNKTRELTGGKYIIMGNNETTAYTTELNGMMFENFPHGVWGDVLSRSSQYLNTNTLSPRLNVFNSNTNNSGNNGDYATMRYGITSSLLQDNVYYSFDHGDSNHGQTWWYDEYNVDLGSALGAPQSPQGLTQYKSGVWTRNFENGISVVNSSNGDAVVELDGDYEKIHGTQDTRMNDGAIVSRVILPAEDGTILLKTFETLTDIPFTNGGFVRFFRADGGRVRNGFFVFDEKYPGGDQIAFIDLNNNGKRETIRIHGSKLLVWRDDGQLLIRTYPYSANYLGKLRVAIGDFSQNGLKEIIVAPSEGYPAPIIVYNQYGRAYRDDWYPFGEKYSGGYSLGIGDIDGGVDTELVIGTGANDKPRITIFDNNYNKKGEWFPFESSFLGGVSVAVGNVTGDSHDEIVVGRGPGGKPDIKIFDALGNQLSSFQAYTTLGSPGVEVQVSDVDFDGVLDIIAMSEDLL